VNPSEKDIEQFIIIRDIISKVTKINKDEIMINSRLYEELKVDPFYSAEIKLLIEEAFHVAINDIEVMNVANIRDIIEIVNEYLQSPDSDFD